jgi:hypothetical protein
MRHRFLRFSAVWIVAFLLILPAATKAQNSTRSKASDLEQTRDIGLYLGQCVQQTMTGQNHTGMREVTFSMLFRSNGTLFGLPVRTYSFPAVTGKQQELFANAVNTALINCAPLPFSKALGEAIAGRKFNYRHTIKPKQDIRL